MSANPECCSACNRDSLYFRASTGCARRVASSHVRARYVALAVGTIAIGLAIHWRGSAISPVVRDVLGDALWAAMVMWMIAAVAPTARWTSRAVVAFAICVAVELSQLWHFPALDSLRQTTIGQLVLGSGFDARDFLAYGAGILAAGVFAEMIARRR